MSNFSKQKKKIICDTFVKNYFKISKKFSFELFVKKDVNLESSKSPISNNKFKKKFE